MNAAQPVLTPQEKVPVEIWLEILALVPATADLHSLSVASRKFYDLTVRALHRNIVWLDPAHAARSLPVWDTYPGMDLAVRSLELGVSAVLPGMSSTLIGLDGQPEAEPVRRPHLLEDGILLQHTVRYHGMCSQSTAGFASPALHDAMFARIGTFKNISTLAFTDMIITNTHFALIHSLPQLRALRLDLCLFREGRGGPPLTFNHADLPLTELTITNLRRQISAMVLAQVHFDEHSGNLTTVLALCTARTLRTLTVDASADVFRLIYNAWNADARGWAIPPQLAHVFVVRRRSARGEAQPVYLGEEAFPHTDLYHFAVRALSLRTLSTPIFVPPNTTIAPEALPLGLERFAAPVETASAVAAARDVQALGVLKCALDGRDAIQALESVAASRPGLKMLMLELRGWDEEVLSAVVKLFKELRRLKIVYEGTDGPSEDFLVTLGPEFLSRMSHLHTLQIYAQPELVGTKANHPAYLYDCSFESIEEELANLVIPYNRYCPTLRKVQFLTGYVVARTWDGAGWAVERLRRLEVKDDLSF
ncbi:uncharacterized protein TRAVEDRAFT_157088 [Trametes versicolor FP-101664 SS1]|uniref:F-box domain-containing protein n=1 Tax=Trametes versicolor (strain FP-101664) TaxID=717944 RepID=R7S7H8_TRAVS|nr:uncharacterized protein TRAVEDRAFT_157088 [Trametes versicolor FP-101664 SS1]EIW51570.1 hypothetical protein TRAVEDRAFT_157088 [Trametes versicolor FP-101664 SS1]